MADVGAAQGRDIKKPIKDEIATAQKDIDIFSGWLTRRENPDPVLRTESSGQGLKLYDDVNRDPHAGSVLQTRYLAVAGCEWEITPAGEDEKDAKIADFVDACLKRINMTQAIQEFMQAVLYGFFVGEVMWAPGKNGWAPAKIIGKHPRRFTFDYDRNLKLLTPQNMIEGEPVPDRKFICFTYGSSDNPYGEGLGQKLWWPVWFKKHGIKYWLIFLEKFGMPTAHGKYPPGTDPADQEKLLDAIDAMQNETGITTPDSMQVELIEATRAGNATYETLCDYMDKQMSKAVLGQTATTEGTPGKLGNEDAQQEVRADIKKADADLLAEVLNHTLIRWIVDYNFAGVTEYPTIWLRTEKEKDLKPLAERDKILVNDIGVKVPESYFYDTYGIPEPEGDEPVVGGAKPESQNPPQSTFSKGGSRENNGEFAEQRFTPDQQAIENLADEALADVSGFLAQNEARILAAIQGAESYEDAMIRILDLYPQMDVSSIEDLLGRLWLNAELYGRATTK